MVTKERKRGGRREPKTHRAASEISAVTAYRDRAMVTRVAHFTLDVGEGTIVVRDLPAALDEYSLRVTGLGPARVRIMGVKIGREFKGRPAAAEVLKRRAALEKAEDEKRALDDRRAVVADRLQRIQETAALAVRDVARNVARRRLELTEAQAAVSFFYNDMDKSNARLAKLDRALRAKERELEKLRFDFEKHESPRLRELKNAEVSFECSAGGEFDLTLSYVMPNAGWEPTYDLRYDEAEGQTEIRYRAAVYQNTGEDWDNVNLKLSTARPQAGVAPPELEPQYLEFFAPAAQAVALPEEPLAKKKYRAQAFAPQEAEADVLYTVAAEEESPALAEMAEALVSAAGPAMTYAVAGRPSVPADGEPHLVAVSRHRFAGELSYVVAPEFGEVAYLRAKAVNDADVTFLPGVANIFRGDEYVGRGELTLTVPGADFEYYLGADDRVKVKYETQRVADDSVGITGSNQKVVYKTQTELTNHAGAAVVVVVKQLLPVSRHKSIKVKIAEAKPKPAAKREDGVITWRLTLKDGEKKTVTFAYDVEFPKGRAVAGV